MSSRNMGANDIAQMSPELPPTGADSMYSAVGATQERLETIGGTAGPWGFDPKENAVARITATNSAALQLADQPQQVRGSAAGRDQELVANRVMTAIGADRSVSRSGVTQTGGGKTESSVNISGTLVLQGLSEAVMQASGRRMEDTPDGGVPIDLGGSTNSYSGR
jgi:hypothetical protein